MEILIINCLTSFRTSIIPVLMIGALSASLILIITSAIGIYHLFNSNTKSQIKIYLITTFEWVVFAGLLSTGVLAIISRSLIERQLQNNLEERLSGEYLMPGGEKLTMLMDLLQTQLHCCGVTSPSDYKNSRWQQQTINSEKLVVPLTCCTLMDETEISNPRPVSTEKCQDMSEVTSRFRHDQGCKNYLVDIASQELLLIVGMCLVACLIIMVATSIICLC